MAKYIKHNHSRYIPKEGDEVWVEGHRMVASNVKLHDTEDPNFKSLRSTGRFVDPKDAMRNTQYDGGTYGWCVESDAIAT